VPAVTNLDYIQLPFQFNPTCSNLNTVLQSPTSWFFL